MLIVSKSFPLDRLSEPIFRTERLRMSGAESTLKGVRVDKQERERSV
jgi:hypothetical protein